MSQYLGDISAYALAVSQGYTGTEEEYAELMASYATVGQTAVTAAQTATTKASEAATSATTATNKATEATTAATTATNKAAEAQADADAAALDASQALSAASTATTKATEATTAAATAVSAKDDAVSANTAAQSAKTAAQTAQTGAETAAASVEASAEQIATNAEDISQLKSELTTITANAIIPVTGYDAYIDLSGDTADIDNPSPSTSGYSYSVVECSEGDVFTISGTSVSIPRAWGFLDASGNVIKREFADKSVTNVVMCAPYGSKYLVINRNNGSTSYYGELITDRVTDNADDIKKADSRFVVGKNLIDPDAVEDGFIDNNKGHIQSSASYKTSDFIPVKAGQSITISPNIRKFLAYDAVKYPIFSSYVTDAVNTAYTYTAQVDGYIRVSYAVANAEQAEYGSTATSYEAYKVANAEGIDFSESQKAYIDDVVEPIESAVEGIEDSFEEVKTDVVASTTVTKTDDNSGYYNQNGYYTDSANYYYSGLIPVTAGDKVYAETSGGTPTRLRYVASYNNSQTAVAGKGWDNGNSSYDWFTVPDGISYVRVTLYTGTATTQIVKVRTVNGESTYYAKTQFQSVLANKKWVACGDSFTEGDFSGLQSADFQFLSGKYVGKKRVYPYVIGLRTGAEIVNEAISGSTMAYVDGTHHEFSMANGRYTQIPSDADYITLYFGINDSHHQVPIGTISDTGNTTFYGAWNTVMQYLITNHPDAKIGIIISNGCDSVDYPNAEIAIAKKYGVSYLDFNSDYKVPMLFRVNGKPDVDSSVISANLAHYRVSSTNGHPNVAMHEYESTIIQHWLESI